MIVIRLMSNGLDKEIKFSIENGKDITECILNGEEYIKFKKLMDQQNVDLILLFPEKLGVKVQCLEL